MCELHVQCTAHALREPHLQYCCTYYRREFAGSLTLWFCVCLAFNLRLYFLAILGLHRGSPGLPLHLASTLAAIRSIQHSRMSPTLVGLCMLTLSSLALQKKIKKCLFARHRLEAQSNCFPTTNPQIGDTTQNPNCDPTLQRSELPATAKAM